MQEKDKPISSSNMTIRQRLMAELSENVLTAKELSKRVRISEKEVMAHLPHVAKSLHSPKRLMIHPPMCHQCGYSFPDRQRFTNPGRCPKCRHEGVSPPAFYIEMK